MPAFQLFPAMQLLPVKPWQKPVLADALLGFWFLNRVLHSLLKRTLYVPFTQLFHPCCRKVSLREPPSASWGSCLFSNECPWDLPGVFGLCSVIVKTSNFFNFFLIACTCFQSYWYSAAASVRNKAVPLSAWSVRLFALSYSTVVTEGHSTMTVRSLNIYLISGRKTVPPIAFGSRFFQFQVRECQPNSRWISAGSPACIEETWLTSQNWELLQLPHPWALKGYLWHGARRLVIFPLSMSWTSRRVQDSPESPAGDLPS